jgi:hypothetical protein
VPDEPNSASSGGWRSVAVGRDDHGVPAPGSTRRPGPQALSPGVARTAPVIDGPLGELAVAPSHTDVLALADDAFAAVGGDHEHHHQTWLAAAPDDLVVGLTAITRIGPWTARAASADFAGVTSASTRMTTSRCAPGRADRRTLDALFINAPLRDYTLRPRTNDYTLPMLGWYTSPPPQPVSHLRPAHRRRPRERLRLPPLPRHTRVADTHRTPATSRTASWRTATRPRRRRGRRVDAAAR